MATVKDFSSPEKEPIPFTIGRDTFYAIPDVPGGVIEDLAAVSSAESESDKMRAISEFLDSVLTDESAHLFAQRFRSKQDPITFKQALSVFEWLVEEYTDDVRPTPAPSSSPNGSGSIEANSGPRRLIGEGSTRRVDVLPSS